MSEPAKKKVTSEDIFAAPDDKIAEIIDGKLIVTPRPSADHALAASALKTF